jgi:hypothetical protein
VKHKSGDYRYRCGSFYKKGGLNCGGQSTYSKNKLDTAVIGEVKQYIIKLYNKEIDNEYVKKIHKDIDELNIRNKLIKDQIAEDYCKLKNMKNEIINILQEESSFTKEILTGSIKEKENDIKILEQKLNENDVNMKKLVYYKDSFSSYYKEFRDWEVKFDAADIGCRRMMLSKVLEKVIVYKDSIELKYQEQIKEYENL